MKKSFIFYPLLIFSTVFSQQVELINDWDEAAVPEGLFAPSSPYRLLQDMLIKDHIFLKTLDKTTSPIYKTKEKHSKLHYRFFIEHDQK
jgi:hypothetical protein